MFKSSDIKRNIFDILDNHTKENRKGNVFEHFIVALILLNVLSIILESFSKLYNSYHNVFYYFEIFSVIIFTCEYILRLWTITLKYEGEWPLSTRLKFVFSPLSIIDILAILPFYLPMFIPFDLRFLRMLRVTRLLRVFKLARYSGALKLIGKIIKDKKDELIVTVFIAFILLLVASTIMYYLEHEAQPDSFPNIVASLWWAIATLTTVGYGDVYPVTGWGKLLSGIIAVLGIGLVALPTAIISSSFLNEINSETKTEECEDAINFCPHCGKKLRH